MTIDEVEKLARYARADEAYGPLYSGTREQILARFVLAVLPAVRAAAAFSKVYHQHPLNQDVIDLVRAVDDMAHELDRGEEK